MLKRGGFRAGGVVAAGVLLIGMTASDLPTGRFHAWDKSGANATTEAQFEEISIEAYGHLREFVCHHAGKFFVDPILTPLDSRDARFKKVRGLADAKVSRLSRRMNPGSTSGIKAVMCSSRDAPKCPISGTPRSSFKKGLAYDQQGWISLAPLTFPGHFLQVRNGQLLTGPRHEDGRIPGERHVPVRKACFARDPPGPRRGPYAISSSSMR